MQAVKILASITILASIKSFNKLLSVLLFAGGFVLCWTDAFSQSADSGEALFKQNCSACHTIGGGDLVGPDLQGVTLRRDGDWLARFIQQPDRMIAEGDSIAKRLLAKYNNIPMPVQGLSALQVKAVLAYLVQQNGTAPSPETGLQVSEAAQAPSGSAQQDTTAAAKVPPGDPQRGKDLFTGAVRLQNGGPPCLACHDVRGVRLLGGGSLGLDLTRSFAKFGQDGMASILASLPFPTMQPIYQQKPLTTEEQAQLNAFFQLAANKTPRKFTMEIALLSATGFLLMLFIAPVVWRKRLSEVRKSLLSQARTQRMEELNG